MVTRMQLLQSLARDMRVNRRRGDIRVPEQELHDAKIGAVVQQMRREGVAHNMRRQRRARDPGARRIALDQLPKRLTRQRRTTLRQEYMLILG